MAKIHKISAQPRSDEGKGASRRLRRAGNVPAILYGGDQEPQSIQFEHEAILLTARNEWFFSSILDLEVGDKVQKVLLRDLQKHPYQQQILHLDFQRINEKQPIRLHVPLHFINQESSPAHKASGVVISHNMTDLEISCLPRDLPEYIEVDLGSLDEGDLIHMSDIKLPENVEIPSLKLGKEHDYTVASAHAVREEVEPEPTEEGEGVEAAGEEAPAGEEAAGEESSADKAED